MNRKKRGKREGREEKMRGDGEKRVKREKRGKREEERENESRRWRKEGKK